MAATKAKAPSKGTTVLEFDTDAIKRREREVEKETDEQILAEAESAAHAAADQYFRQELGGRDQFACGFAWVKIYGVRGNTRIGRALKATGIRPSYSGGLEMWNPSKFGCQNVDTLEAGARAAAAVFEKYGFEAYAGSRLD